MRISQQFRIDMQKVLVITVAWILVNIFIAIYNYTVLHSIFSKGAVDGFSLGFHLFTNTLIAIMGGLSGGYFLVYVNRQIFRKRSFAYAARLTFFVYTGLYILISIVIIFIIADHQLGPEASFSRMMDLFVVRFFSADSVVFYVLWGIIMAMTLFLLQVNDKFGPGVLPRFLLGRYFKPREEQRLFMFLDMRGSTRIAEKIGHKAYFSMLQDCFGDMTRPILTHKGEIYQYVGDEVIISWTLKRGFRNANCFRCFEAIRSRFESRSDYYMNKYGFTPEFKAGVHFGRVMAGEIGEIKKDIVFSGDVLNTTARIQNLCNQYGVDFLVSDATLARIQGEMPYRTRAIGEVNLRGREDEVGLNAVLV